MTVNRFVEVIDEHGRTAVGGLVLDAETFRQLCRVLAWRTEQPHESRNAMMNAEAKLLAESLWEHNKLDFEVYT